jgi:hypothetical protein
VVARNAPPIGVHRVALGVNLVCDDSCRPTFPVNPTFS